MHAHANSNTEQMQAMHCKGGTQSRIKFYILLIRGFLYLVKNPKPLVIMIPLFSFSHYLHWQDENNLQIKIFPTNIKHCSEIEPQEF